MTKEEIRELIADMRAMGLDVELCDTPVPVSVVGVPCGSPAELGDQCIDDYVMVPKSVVGNHPEMLVPVIGDSMLDAGYEEGDKLRIRFGIKPRDGEDVLAVIDNAATIKTLYTDEDVNKWLAEQLDKDPATVSKWCTNSCQPSLETLMQIARVLGVTADDLLRLEELPAISEQ